MLKYITKENIDLKNYNTLGIGGFAKYLYEPNNFFDLKEAIIYYQKSNIKYYVLGEGSNVILPDEDFSGVIISLKNLNEIIIDDEKVIVMAGVKLPYFNYFLLKNGYVNFIWTSGIPGTLGGAIYGNAGAYNHNIFEDLIKITVLKNNEIVELNKNDISYSYRFTSLTDEIILSAEFNLKKGNINEATKMMKENLVKRSNNQPLEYKNAGSTFRNPENNFAGSLIEQANLKGKKIGGAKVSLKHANFIINEKNATSDDIIKLIDEIKKEVRKNSGIDLVLENKIIKWEEL